MLVSCLSRSTAKELLLMTDTPDRQRKKNEDLANQIFGRAKAKQSAEKKQKERTPSLASRMGVQKVCITETIPPRY